MSCGIGEPFISVLTVFFDLGKNLTGAGVIPFHGLRIWNKRCGRKGLLLKKSIKHYKAQLSLSDVCSQTLYHCQCHPSLACRSYVWASRDSHCRYQILFFFFKSVVNVLDGAWNEVAEVMAFEKLQGVCKESPTVHLALCQVWYLWQLGS